MIVGSYIDESVGNAAPHSRLLLYRVLLCGSTTLSSLLRIYLDVDSIAMAAVEDVGLNLKNGIVLKVSGVGFASPAAWVRSCFVPRSVCGFAVRRDNRDLVSQELIM